MLSTDKMFSHNFLFSFPRESSFPRQIPGSDIYIYIYVIGNEEDKFCDPA